MPAPSPLLTDDFLKKAIAVASYYGFKPIELVAPVSKPKEAPVDPRYRRDAFGNEASSMMRHFSEASVTPGQSLLVYHVSSGERGDPLEEHPRRVIRFGLSTVGIDKSIAEALILHTTTSILYDAGVTSLCVHLNSIGDRDSTARFTREVTNYLRKNLSDIPTTLREAFKKDVFHAFELMAHREHPLFENMPKPMQFLSDASRRHLREVIEYLETIGIPYALSDTVVGHKNCYSQTLFEVLVTLKDRGEELCVARGGRCDELAEQLFGNRFSTVGIVIEGKRPRRKPITKRMSRRKPKFYLIQIGFGAKLRSLPLIETLRKARISLHQSLGSDQLGDQLLTAKELGIPYALIVGQREVLDNTIIVRDMETQAQQVVSLETLPAHLKSI